MDIEVNKAGLTLQIDLLVIALSNITFYYRFLYVSAMIKQANSITIHIL